MRAAAREPADMISTRSSCSGSLSACRLRGPHWRPRAARTREAVIVNDVRSDPGWLPNPLLPETAAELAVPLLVGGQLLGVLDVQSAHRGIFTAEDASIQTTLAAQVASSLQNLNSFRQAQDQAQRETALNLISQKIQSATSVEAGVKYFLLGAFSSGILLYGISLLYGAAGAVTTNLEDLNQALALTPGTSNLLVFTGVLMVLVGMAFKVAAVPFHMWSPDAYEGAPTPITAFMATAPKAAALAARLEEKDADGDARALGDGRALRPPRRLPARLRVAGAALALALKAVGAALLGFGVLVDQQFHTAFLRHFQCFTEFQFFILHLCQYIITGAVHDS